MFSKKRQQLLLEHLAAHKSAQVTQLLETFDVSVSTLRRDLIVLESQGMIQRVHGGVLYQDKTNEPPIMQRAAHQAEAKRRIGEAAARLVGDGDTILVSGGTTAAAMIPFLAAKRGLTVITNSVSNAYTLTQYPHIAVAVLGGWLRHVESTVHGTLTESGLRELQPGIVFYGVFGLSPEQGLSGSDLQEVQTDRHFISIAPRLVILADHTKFGRLGPVRSAPIDVISTLITDVAAPADQVASLRSKGIEVILA